MLEKLKRRFIDEYKRRGFRYGGMIPEYCLREEGFESKDIQQLKEEGFLQLRDCDDYSFEIVLSERRKIIEESDLYNKWMALDISDAYESEIENEINKCLVQ